MTAIRDLRESHSHALGDELTAAYDSVAALQMFQRGIDITLPL